MTSLACAPWCWDSRPGWIGDAAGDDTAGMHLLPKPQLVEGSTGRFGARTDDAIDGPPEWAAIVRRLLTPGTGLELPSREGGRIRITADPELGLEAYRLVVSTDRIEISASDSRGVNWAVQTLRQLLPNSVLRSAPTAGALTVPCVRIEDRPRFGWRGVMLDVARHFMPYSDLLRFVDILALHKYNVLHLHLTDDQGWRFASARYPRLQEVASWRRETRRPADTLGDGTPHGGYYTQEQLRSLVAYADDRGITIVPELEFPGHVRALLAAYPELGHHAADPQETATTFGVFDEVLTLTESTMSVVFDLYDELLDVFPSPYIHVGGDECPRTEWLADPADVELARRRGLDGPEHLQRWLTLQLRDWLAERGRRLLGWDEICDEGPVPDGVAVAWRDSSCGVRAAQAGMAVIMAPLTHTYFDYYAAPPEDEPYAIGGLTRIEQAYSFEPLAGVPAENQASVLGTQCQIWTEYMPTARHVEYMLYPRACAHSEVAWSEPEGRSWAEFEPRLTAHLDRLDALGVNYRPLAGPHPWQRGEH
jgi:hexosaminidase